MMYTALNYVDRAVITWVDGRSASVVLGRRSSGGRPERFQ